MDESVFWLIMTFGISAFACFAVIVCGDPIIEKISERKAVRTIIRSICGVLTFVVTFGVLLICFFGK